VADVVEGLLERTVVGVDSATVLAENPRPIRAIGSAADPLAVADKYRVLNVPQTEWSMELNDAWVGEAIANREIIYLSSKITDLTTWRPARGNVAVYARELLQFLSAGYWMSGDFLFPADLLP
jgi:hypothetical protein